MWNATVMMKDGKGIKEKKKFGAMEDNVWLH